MRAAWLVFALLACERTALSSPPTRPAAAPSAPKEAARLQVVIQSSSGASVVQAEIARDGAERERGLMFRRSLGADEGMLFVFPESSEQRFWMKNTLVPLDMVFIGEDHRIVGIVENAEPRTLTPRTVGAPSRYVLEVAGGTAFARGWRRGDRVAFDEVPGVR